MFIIYVYLNKKHEVERINIPGMAYPSMYIRKEDFDIDGDALYQSIIENCEYTGSEAVYVHPQWNRQRYVSHTPIDKLALPHPITQKTIANYFLENITMYENKISFDELFGG